MSITNQNNRKYIVYKHTSPSNKVYIGITSKRMLERSGSNGIHYKNNIYFYNAIKKYGWYNFKHEILCEGLTKKEACEKEQYYIKLYNATSLKYGYNHTSGGETGYYLSEHSKMKLSEKTKLQWQDENIRAKMIDGLRKSHAGIYTPLQRDASIKRRGTHLNLEIRQKISQALKGRKGKPMSNELKEKIAQAHRGKIPSNKGVHLSEDQKQVISQKTKEGMKRPDVKRKIIESNKRRIGVTYKYKVNQYDLQGKFIAQYNGYVNASRETGISKTAIANCVYGKTRTAGGFLWAIQNKQED